MSNCDNSCSGDVGNGITAGIAEHVIQIPRSLPKITVNGQPLDNDLLAREIQYHPAKNFAEAKRKASQALVIRQVLLDKVQSVIDAGVDEETAIANLIDEHIPAIVVTETECERFYHQNMALFQTSPLMVVRHILLAADKDDLQGRAEQKKLADKLLSDLHRADNPLAAFAEQVHLSRCPSKSDGGLLGEIAAGQTVPEFERQVFMLEEGLAAAPIETRYGYHLVYVEKKQPGEAMTLSMCMDKIRRYLTERRYRQSVSDYLHEQVEAADISGITLQIDQENIIIR